MPIALLFVGLLIVNEDLQRRAVAEDKFPDRVVLQRQGSKSRITLSCSIIDYTGKSIRVLGRNGEIRSFDTADVLTVSTPQLREQVVGERALSLRDTKTARQSLEAALIKETRLWVRRDLLAALVKTALMSGDFSSACSRFVLIVKSEPETRHLGLLPLLWGPRIIKADLKARARQWTLQSGTFQPLIGASILLLDADWTRTAENTLKRLARSRNQAVRDLARIQLWRKRMRAGRLSRAELEHWQGDIERLPEPMRGGPYYLLGRAYQQRRENEQAAAAFLWLPLVYSQDHHLAGRACLEAADALIDVGQNRSARILYREVIARFADTSFAQDAKAQLKMLTALPSKTPPREE
ncbi:MAG: hypothetical protein IID45_11490 [Planctomycetes bacterium]|nr:hypothetical protein [Planctomycetota bacterium]